MSDNAAAPIRFRPERPIYLNEQNTEFKTRDQVIFAVEKLRARNWLCVYDAEKMRPFHMSFNLEKELAEFKKDCENLDITLKAPLIKLEDIETLNSSEMAGQTMPEATASDTHEDPDGSKYID